MQATVFTFDPDSSSGTVVTDEGRTMAFDAAAFRASGLRLLRPGQRIRATMSPAGDIAALTILTLPEPEATTD